MENSTVTLNELAQIFRDHGIPTTEGTLAQEIQNGVYPFAQCTKEEPRRKFLILRKPLDEWLQQNTYKGEK